MNCNAHLKKSIFVLMLSKMSIPGLNAVKSAELNTGFCNNRLHAMKSGMILSMYNTVAKQLFQNVCKMFPSSCVPF